MSTAPDTKIWNTLKELPSNVWRSVFRNPLPSTDLERSECPMPDPL